MADSQILGIGELRQTFSRLKAGMEGRTARAMVVAGGGVLKKKAKAIALANGSRRTGAMIANIAIKREPSAQPGTVVYHLGVRNGRNLTAKQKKTGKHLAVGKGGRIVVRYTDNPYYWKWVEFGHRIVGRANAGAAAGLTTFVQRLRNGQTVTRTAKHSGAGLRARRRNPTGMVAPEPFIRPALEQGREETIAAMAARLQKELDKAAQP